MPSLRNLMHHAKACCVRIKHTSSTTITGTEPTRSCDDIKPNYNKSVIITEVELPPTTPRSSLDSTTSTLVNFVDLPQSNDDSAPQPISSTSSVLLMSVITGTKLSFKSTTSPSVIPKKTISWTDNYHIIGPSANKRELDTIHKVIRDDSEVGFTAEDSAIWKLNKSVHRETNNEENICTGYCGAQKIRFLREEEFRRQEVVEEAAYESWKEKADERKKKWAEQVREIVWEEEEEDGEVMACRDDESDEDED